MKMKPSLALFVSLALAAAALTGCSGSSSSSAAASGSDAASSESGAAAKASIQIKYSTWAADGEAAYEGMKEFKKYVEEGSNGDIEVLLYPSNQAGSTNEQVEQVSMNQLQMMSSGDPGIKEIEYLCLPYLFSDLSQYNTFLESDLGQKYVQQGISSRNTRILDTLPRSPRIISCNSPVNSLADLKGMKLRVSNDPVMNGMVEGLGANPTVVSFGELYSALQTGVVDGAEQPIANYKSNAFPEVANNLILDGHTLGAVQAVITDNAWNKLTENQQAAVMEAAADTQAFNADLSETAENKVLDELKSSGCNVVDVPDKAPWQEACAKVISENTSDQAELYQQLLDMKA